MCWLYEWTYRAGPKPMNTLLVEELFESGRTKVRYVGGDAKAAKNAFYEKPTGGEVHYIKRGKVAGRRH